MGQQLEKLHWKSHRSERGGSSIFCPEVAVLMDELARKLVNMVSLQEEAPTTVRQPVLMYEPEEIVAVLTTAANRGRWFVVADDVITRRGTFSQTAHRIRVGKIEAFKVPEDGSGGRYEAVVEATVDPVTNEKTGGVKLFARWVPAGGGASEAVDMASGEPSAVVVPTPVA